VGSAQGLDDEHALGVLVVTGQVAAVSEAEPAGVLELNEP
jgi:hypothetical protein